MKLMKLRDIIATVVVNCGRKELKAGAVAAGWVTDVGEGGCDEEVGVDGLVEQGIDDVGAWAELEEG